MDDDAEIIAEFLIESYENLDRLVDDLLALEADPTATSTLASAFRTVHTIKGTCGFLGFGHLEGVTHVGEHLLSRLRDGALEVRPDIVTTLLELADVVRVMLSHIESTGTDGNDGHVELVGRLTALAEGQVLAAVAAPVAAVASDPEATADAAAEAPGVDAHDDLDPPAEPAVAGPAVAGPVGATLVAAGAVAPDDVSLALSAQDLGDDRRLGDILVSHGAARREDLDAATGDATSSDAAPEARGGLSESTIRVDIGVLDRLMNLVGELVLSRNNISQHVEPTSDPAFVAAAQTLDTVTGELQECVMTTRMQPIGSVWSRFNRVVRDLAVQCGKQVRIEVDGEETELDKTILEAIKDPLTHIVRNTVDHGIETPEVRVAAGKPAEGVLYLRAHHEGGHVLIEIADDGGGIDPARIVARAIERGLVSEHRAASMSRREIIALVFEPGFSTAEAVTNVSGRGVGMDVVKTNIERIGGTIEVDSEVGVGTTLRLTIPLTLAIVPALMVRCAGQQFALPQVEVHELVRMGPGEHATEEMLHQAPVMRLRGRLLPLVRLRDVLGLPHDDGEFSIVAVVSSESRRWGLVLDGVAATEEIVVKPLGRQLRTVTSFSGATVLGDGQIALILDIARIGRESGIAAVAGRAELEAAVAAESLGDTVKLLVVAAGGERLAVELADLDRLEQFRIETLEYVGGVTVVQYRDRVMPISFLASPAAEERVHALVFERHGSLVALGVDQVVDVADVVLDPSTATGTVVAHGLVTRVLDVDQALAPALDWVSRNGAGMEVYA